MVTTFSKTEIKECMTNAVVRLVKEGKSLDRFDDELQLKKDNKFKKGVKHSKMKPQGKEKYKGKWTDDVE